MSGNPAASADTSDFSADASILGFKYQLRYALFLLFEAQRTGGLDVSIDIEQIDDIDVQMANRVTKLVQTKDISTVLTNSSAPFWKTIRIWCDAIRTGAVDLTHIQKFSLVSTSNGPHDDTAIVSRIQQGTPESRHLALDQMRTLAAAKLNLATLGRAYRAFHELPHPQQQALVEKITVITNAMSLDVLDKCICEQIVHGPPDKRLAFGKVLFGRWDSLVEGYLRERPRPAISWNTLQMLLHEISLQFSDDNLPLDFVGMLKDAMPSLADDQRTFVQQLIAIGATAHQQQRAQRLFLRTTQLLGFWQRHVLLRPDEVSAHIKRLSDECELQHETAATSHQLATATPLQIGLHIYNWATNTAPHQDGFRLRKKCDDADVIRGCFHQLADRPLLGWHPDWKRMFT